MGEAAGFEKADNKKHVVQVLERGDSLIDYLARALKEAQTQPVEARWNDTSISINKGSQMSLEEAYQMWQLTRALQERGVDPSVRKSQE